MKTGINILGICFCILLISFSGASQELVFVNQKRASFIEGTKIYVTIQADRKESIEFITETGKINLNSFSFDSILTLKADGGNIHEYTNQYFPKQFEKLDTVVLYQYSRIYETTPRFFLKKDYNLDSAIRSDAEFLKIFSDDSSSYSSFFIKIYHSGSLSRKDKKQIKEVKTAFCKEVGVDEKKILVKDKNIPYSTRRFDFFNPETLISDSFIKRQNTPWMKSKAEEYSLVLLININWK